MNRIWPAAQLLALDGLRFPFTFTTIPASAKISASGVSAIARAHGPVGVILETRPCARAGLDDHVMTMGNGLARGGGRQADAVFLRA